MVKAFLLLFWLLLSLEARENPFFPATGELDVPLTTNQKEDLEPLKRATITLPSSARTVESITIKYKNIDGSLVTKTQELGNSIDWHLPLFLSQNYADGDTQQKENKQTPHYRELIKLNFVSLYGKKREIKVLTKDKMLRNFLLVKPHRIVCDFKRELNSRSFEKNFKNIYGISSIKIGNHKGYYRIVIELDGFYRYKTTQQKDGYLFTLL